MAVESGINQQLSKQTALSILVALEDSRPVDTITNVDYNSYRPGQVEQPYTPPTCSHEYQDLFLSTSCESVGVVSRLENWQKEWITDYQNTLRKSVNSSNMMKVFWDDKLACQAQRVVNTCRWGHNNVRKYKGGKVEIGQNIIAYFLNKKQKEFNKEFLQDMMYRFYREKEDYTYPDPFCHPNKMCDHYRVMMIAQTSKIGGACKFCDHDWRNDNGLHHMENSTRHAAFCVINYETPLSAIGAVPMYRMGAPCSDCDLDWSRCQGDQFCVPCDPKHDGPDCKNTANCKDIATKLICALTKENKGIDWCSYLRTWCRRSCGVC